MTTYVHPFREGSKDQKDLLGGKGANLAEMTRLGLPVPPGFTITTDACRYVMHHGQNPPDLADEVAAALEDVEGQIDRRFGDPEDPLLVSVRSGAAISMPGMMETVLNVGLNDETVQGLAAQSGSERFAQDSYRRLLQMYGATVLGIAASTFEEALEAVREDRGAADDAGLDVEALRELVGSFQDIIERETGTPFPQDPHEQLRGSISAVFESWNAPRAIVYRNAEHIDHELGTAVNVVAMVFGNLDERSATGVAFTRDPSTGEHGVYGDFLVGAQGEDVVAGIRNTRSLEELEEVLPEAYAELLRIMDVLEEEYRDLCDIEFTIESGKLWMLQTRVGKRTAAAAFLIAAALIDEGAIDEHEALTRVSGAQLTRLMFPRFAGGERTAVARGMGASPGAAVGEVVFDSETVIAHEQEGRRSLLVRRETNPDDLGGMLAAEGVLTSRGGKTSHAAVVARGLGKTCVCGAESLDVDPKAREVRLDGEVVAREGDVLSIDGTTGEVFAGEVPVEPSEVAQYLEGELPADDPSATALVRAVDRLMGVADQVRRMQVRANADTADDAGRARTMGAEGIGLARTEHMFLGERRAQVEKLILAGDPAEREEALAELLPAQRDDFAGLMRAMGELPLTIRLLDPPLHEFLPDLTDLSVRIARAEGAGRSIPTHERKVLAAVERLHEQNPMLGLRGVRLGLTIPGLFGMQVRAILEAELAVRAEGVSPHVEIMIPLVGSVRELRAIRREIDEITEDVAAGTTEDLTTRIGTMIELPRAALRAGEIAEAAEFFSFGTNDLTQTTWGFSRDDVEAGFFFTYKERGILSDSPFESLDQFGVGELVRIAAERGRATNPELTLGVCGEHGGDPASIHFFHSLGLDYVSCSPFRVPVARLEAGRASLLEEEFTPQP
ncbi:pyruvate, phosphate dikinase [Brachybacterium endophyticum]|uniref:Pyruvate, phosphate dikinase n=1 Tax=Brachybacterium endophyticum TaxID=2182385 RepID=A0A2U2RKY4_9MICO|nr:pyruvate, phosphate dikinase [Brachybacterium endophyticum]PWH06539.1 pyruvate, phosphate dikinase [Brachybacterium endophyticum]